MHEGIFWQAVCTESVWLADPQGILNSSFNGLRIFTEWTGLYDKNKNKVYEGDIVRDENGNVFIVEYGVENIDAFEGIGFNLWGFTGNDYKATRLQNSTEVIGNIFEHPEIIIKNIKTQPNNK